MELAQTINEAFRPLMYEKSAAYDTLLSPDVNLTFDDLEAMEELMLVHREALNLQGTELKGMETPAGIYVFAMEILSGRDQLSPAACQVFEDYVIRGVLPRQLPGIYREIRGWDRSRFDDSRERFLRAAREAGDKPFTKKLLDEDGKPLTGEEFNMQFHHTVAPQGVSEKLHTVYRWGLWPRLRGERTSKHPLAIGMDEIYMTLQEE